MACILLWSSAVRVHDSQAYRKMDVTRERISRILELREILLSIQINLLERTQDTILVIACLIFVSHGYVRNSCLWLPSQFHRSGLRDLWNHLARIHTQCLMDGLVRRRSTAD